MAKTYDVRIFKSENTGKTHYIVYHSNSRAQYGDTVPRLTAVWHVSCVVRGVYDAMQTLQSDL